MLMLTTFKKRFYHDFACAIARKSAKLSSCPLFIFNLFIIEVKRAAQWALNKTFSLS